MSTAAPPAEEAPPRLLRDNLVVGTGTALSRITGVGRFFAVYLLAGDLRDTYVLANNTPNIVYELILGGILTATLVPLFTEQLVDDDREGTDAVVSVIGVSLLALTVITCGVAPLLMWLYSSQSPEGVSQGDFLFVGVQLSLLFAPQVLFYGLMAVGSALLNARRRFFAAAWAPVLNNLIVIGALALVPTVAGGKPGVEQAARELDLRLLIGLGTTAGIAAMALSLLPALWRAGVRFRVRLDVRHPAVRKAARLSGWTLGYVLANQVAALTVNALNEPGSGDVTSYAVAFMFFQLPHGLLAVSLMTTFQPDLARSYVARDWPGYHSKLLQGLRLLVVVIVPASIGYLCLALLIGRLGPDASLFASGTAAEMLPVADALAGFAPGLIGFSVYLFVLRGFYAAQDTRRPFWINLVENGLNIAVGIALVIPFGLVGLAAAYSVAYLIGAVIAVAVLLRTLPAGFDTRGFVDTLLRCLAAAAAMAAAVTLTVLAVTRLDPDLLPVAVIVAVPVGAVVYLLGALVSGAARHAGLERRLPGPLARLGRR